MAFVESSRWLFVIVSYVFLALAMLAFFRMKLLFVERKQERLAHQLAEVRQKVGASDVKWRSDSTALRADLAAASATLRRRERSIRMIHDRTRAMLEEIRRRKTEP